MKKIAVIFITILLLGTAVFFMGKAFTSLNNSHITQTQEEEQIAEPAQQNNDASEDNAIPSDQAAEQETALQVNNTPEDEDPLTVQDDTQQSSDTQKLPDDVIYIDGVAYNNLHAETRVDFDYPNGSEKTWEKRITEEGDEYNVFLHDMEGDYNIQIYNVEIPHFEIYEEDEKTLQNIYEEKDFQQDRIMSYEEYAEYCEKYGLSKAYDNPDLNYIVTSENLVNTDDINYMRIADIIKISPQKLGIYYAMSEVSVRYSPLYTTGFIAIIPIDKSITEYEYYKCYTEAQYKKVSSHRVYGKETKKPVIYLYPEEPTKISISLSSPERITCSYPKLEDTWHVKADPNGTLTDLETGRNLYCLYYEAIANNEFKVQDDGFVVESEDIAAFLEEKLSILGLNEREAEEFIIYWLPELEKSPYNYIRFAESSEIENEMRLEINPKPDTLVRILMTYKGLDKPINVFDQDLTSPKREGFVAVEWGGTEIP